MHYNGYSGTMMMMAEPPSTPSRHEKSLGLLTIKFVNLLQEAQDGVLDLKVVSITICLETTIAKV